jgi:peptidoglycan LD-endopeptidase LytH
VDFVRLFAVRKFAFLVLVMAITPLAWGEMFVLPTPNKSIFQPGREAEYFVPTPGRTWESGTFGCVRSDGWQLHEGLDIKCVQRDKRGEAADPIYASAAGKVAYLNSKVGLSNYGRYVILEHDIEGIKIFTTYAHMSEFAPGLSIGDKVSQGQVIGKMGRSSNTRSGISKERAHLHFEICLRLNQRFAQWHNINLKGERNDHGDWNGRNFVGLDPRQILLQQKKLGSDFSLLTFIRERPELCRVLVRDSSFPFLREYSSLVRRNPLADRNGVAAYEIRLDFNGVPFELVPRSAEEISGKGLITLLSVNEKEQQTRPCRKLVTRRNGKWDLGNAGAQLISLLRF